jgi:hypothetical protein
MTEGQIYLVLALAAVYAPFIVADGLFRGRRGGGVWKFLSFCFCTLAILSVYFGSFGFGVGVVLWLIAWVFAGVTRHTASRDAVQNATLKAIQEQNELLRKQQQELLTNQQSLHH